MQVNECSAWAFSYTICLCTLHSCCQLLVNFRPFSPNTLTNYIAPIGRKQEMGVTGCSMEFSYIAEKAIVLQLTGYHWPSKTWPQLLKSEKKIVQCGRVLTSQRKCNNSTKIQRHWCWPSPPKQGLWERLSGLYTEFCPTRHSLHPRIDTAPADQPQRRLPACELDDSLLSSFLKF